MEKQKVIVYVDGFNFYYGLKKDIAWKRYYWLDLVKLFEKFMQKSQTLVAVKYFSARPINNDDKARRQNNLFDANKENPKFKLIMGKYLKKKIVCKRCGFVINTYEEKESDVRIATQIVNDVKNGECNVAIVVSADSDMIPAIELAKSAGGRVSVFFPPNHHSGAIEKMTGIKCCSYAVVRDKVQTESIARCNCFEKKRLQTDYSREMERLSKCSELTTLNRK